MCMYECVCFLCLLLILEQLLSVEFANCSHIQKHTSQILLTSNREFSRSSDDKATKLDFAGIIPNVIFFHLLDGQNVSLLDDAGPPLLWTAFLHFRERQAGQNFYKKNPKTLLLIQQLRCQI